MRVVGEDDAKAAEKRRLQPLSPQPRNLQRTVESAAMDAEATNGGRQRLRKGTALVGSR